MGEPEILTIDKNDIDLLPARVDQRELILNNRASNLKRTVNRGILNQRLRAARFDIAVFESSILVADVNLRRRFTIEREGFADPCRG